MGVGLLNIKITITILSLFFLGFFPQARAQESESQENSEIKSTELELEKNIPKNNFERQVAPVYEKKADVVNLSPLQEESGNSQIVVIQKNYMPKTGRYAVNLGFTLFPSDVLFRTFGTQIRASYYLSERWGVELNGILLTSAKTSELDDLQNKQGVSVSNLATLKNYFGGQVYFSSMYGKYAFNDRRIYPFEIYQTAGAGVMQTDKSSSSAITLGAGQMISISRDSALRLDLNLMLYQTETVTGSKQSQSSFLINFGYSAIFPSVGKRW